MDREKLIATLRQIKALAEEGLRAVNSQVRTQRQSFESTPAKGKSFEVSEIDFGKPVRPFIKTYGKGLSGPKKFTLLLSWLAKGDPKKQVPLSEIQTHWGRMTAKSLLGMKFNRFYPAEARNNDWVELTKKGSYTLRPSWREILKD